MLHGEAIRFAFGKAVKHIIHGVFIVFIILLDLHAGDHVHQRIHIPILGRPLKNDIGNQGAVQKRFRFRPKWIALLTLALGVGNQGVHEFQDVGLVADIRQRVVVHGLGKVYAVEHLDLIAPALEKGPDLSQHTALGVYHHIRGMSLQKLRREPKAGFAGARRADPAEIEVAGVGWIFGAGIHGKPFCGGQQHIVFKLGIDKRLDVFFVAPAGCAILGIAAKFLCFSRLAVDQQPEADNADKPIQRGKAGGKAGKGRADGLAQPQQLFPEARASGQTVCRADFQAKPADEQVRDVRKNILPDFICRHAPPPLSVPAGAAFSPVPPPAGAAPGAAAAGIWPVSAPNGNTRQSSL